MRHRADALGFSRCGARGLGDDERRNPHRDALVQLRRNLHGLVLREHQREMRPIDEIERLRSELRQSVGSDVQQ